MNQFPLTLLAAAGGGAVGASLRYLFLVFGVSGALGIFLLNVAGSFALGFMLTWLEGRSELLAVFVGTGLLGALTTFSTFSSDSVRLFSQHPLYFTLYVGASVMVALGLFLLGSHLARAVL